MAVSIPQQYYSFFGSNYPDKVSWVRLLGIKSMPGWSKNFHWRNFVKFSRNSGRLLIYILQNFLQKFVIYYEFLCKFCQIHVRELMGQVRNVVLMNVYLDLENPGGSGFWVGGIWARWGNGEVSLRAAWERGGRILSQQGGFQVSREREKGEQGGKRAHAMYINYVWPCI